MGSFPPDKVKLIAVNQGEAAFTIQTFLANQNLELDVALDEDGLLAKRFLIDSLPQTIVIDAKGKVARVFVGAPPTLYSGLSKSISGLLTPTD